MSTEMIQVGCRLPNGYVLEVGFTVNSEGKGRGGAPFAMYRKDKSYRTVTLKGLNQRSLIRDPATNKPFAVAPAQIDREPFINTIPKDLWDRWIKDNAEQWVVVTGQIFVIPRGDGTALKAVTLDARSKGPNIFEPIDQSAAMKIEANNITKFDKDE